MVVNAIIYGLLFAIVGVGVYIGLVYRENSKTSKKLSQAQEKQAQLLEDVSMLKKTYQSGGLSDEQRMKVKALYADAISELKKQSAIVASLDKGL